MTTVKPKRQVPVLNLPSLHEIGPHVGQLQASPEYDYYMYLNVVNAIHYANQIGSVWATVVHVTGASHYWEIESCDWVSALKNILPRFEAIENWDLCIKVRDLINALTYGE